MRCFVSSTVHVFIFLLLWSFKLKGTLIYMYYLSMFLYLKYIIINTKSMTSYKSPEFWDKFTMIWQYFVPQYDLDFLS